MIAIWAGVRAGCLAAIPCPCQICERGRLPQTHVFIKVAVSRMGWSRRRSRLLSRGCTFQRILISAICAVSFSVTFPVDDDAQVICFAVKFIAGTFCRACWNWRAASLKTWYLFKGLVQTYCFYISKRSFSFHDTDLRNQYLNAHSLSSNKKKSHFFPKVKLYGGIPDFSHRDWRGTATET